MSEVEVLEPELEVEAVENEVVETEAVEAEAVEAEAAEEKVKRPRLSDADFYRINEELVLSGKGSIASIAAATGMKPASVQQRRGAFNKRYREHGLELTALPRGGVKRMTDSDIGAAAANLLRLRALLHADKEADEAAE